MRLDWQCALCEASAAGTAVKRSRRWTHLCDWCEGELVRTSRDWCARGRHTIAPGERHPKKSACRACERKRNDQYPRDRTGYARAWRAANPERARVYYRQYRAANRKALLAKQYERYWRNPEAARRKAHERRWRRIDEWRAWRRARYLRNIEEERSSARWRRKIQKLRKNVL